MWDVCAKFDQNTLNASVAYVHKVISIFDHDDLGLKPLPWKSIGVIFSSWATTVLSLIKINSKIWSLSCSEGYIYNYLLWPWPLTFKINRTHALVMINMSTTFDVDAHNGLVSTVFTRSKCNKCARTDRLNYRAITLSPLQCIVITFLSKRLDFYVSRKGPN